MQRFRSITFSAVGLFWLCFLSQVMWAQGTVSAWGNNYFGQLGDGTTVCPCLNTNTPVPVTGLTGMTAISAGVTHSLGLKSDGTVVAWGANTFAWQLGNGTNANSNRFPSALIRR